MSQLQDVAERDGWRCWLCDEPVDPSMSVNDSRGPSVDGRGAAAAAKSKGKHGRKDDAGDERLAHRGCNTKKGAIKAVIPWPDRLFVADPAPLMGVAERLERRGGREGVARCPTRSDAQATAEWLEDRFSRLTPATPIITSIEPGGGQFMVAVAA
ncbi:MAG: hypothetical protein JWN61_2640, partial [Pseudonocardiales bacterium]|nr:hypothetical protein [Pseudonocardiales bacterium]